MLALGINCATAIDMDRGGGTAMLHACAPENGTVFSPPDPYPSRGDTERERPEVEDGVDVLDRAYALTTGVEAAEVPPSVHLLSSDLSDSCWLMVEPAIEQQNCLVI